MRTWIFLSGLHGLLGVAAGAFGAHALKDRLLAAGLMDTWKTAAHYELVHGVAMLAASLALGAMAEDAVKRYHLRGALFFWFSGSSLFSGSLYLFCLSGPRWLVWLTPLGGVLLLVGWLALLLPCVKGENISGK